MATGDVVMKANSKEEELIDVNLQKNYEKVLERLDWEE